MRSKIVLDAHARRHELGDFLRRARERLTPQQVGLQVAPRQRTPGLRREQVAIRAGMSETWYTRLEQGRAPGVSVQALLALADALLLEPVEREYILALASTLPAPSVCLDDLPSLQHLLDSVGAMPALVLAASWEILAWTPAATLVFGDFGALPPLRRTAVWLACGNPRTRAMVRDWPEQARAVLAQFRVTQARYAGDPTRDAIVSDLRAASPECDRWWQAHDIRAILEPHRTYDHPDLGRLDFALEVMSVHGSDGLWLVTFVPDPATPTASRLAAALAE